jgi:hypothetical protein
MLTSSAIVLRGLGDEAVVELEHEDASDRGHRPRRLDAEVSRAVEAVELKAGGVA